MTSFDEYVLSRRFNFGRGSDAAWDFIVYAKGEPKLRTATSWRELSRLLEKGDVDPAIKVGAKSCWRSYTHLRWRYKQPDADRPAKCTLD